MANQTTHLHLRHRGLIPTTQLGTGLASPSNFLRGDQQWSDRYVHAITSSSSNSFIGQVDIRAGNGVALAAASNTITISSTAGGGGGADHNLLSATHLDTLVGTIVRGDLIRGNSTPKWERLPISGSAPSNAVLVSDGTDAYWRWPAPVDRITASASNVFWGQVDFRAGTNTNLAVSSNTITINAAGSGGGGSGSTLVGAPAAVYAPGLNIDATVTGDNLGINGGTFACQIFIPATMNLRSLQYRNMDTATARSMEWGLYRDDGSATCTRVADGTDSFTPSAASNRTSAATGAPVTLSPGVYWIVMRNTGGATNFQIGFVVNGNAAIGIINNQSKTLGSALSATLDMSTGWTRTSNNSMAVALRGSVFGESSAF